MSADVPLGRLIMQLLVPVFPPLVRIDRFSELIYVKPLSWMLLFLSLLPVLTCLFHTNCFYSRPFLNGRKRP